MPLALTVTASSLLSCTMTWGSGWHEQPSQLPDFMFCCFNLLLLKSSYFQHHCWWRYIIKVYRFLDGGNFLRLKPRSKFWSGTSTNLQRLRERHFGPFSGEGKGQSNGHCHNFIMYLYGSKKCIYLLCILIIDATLRSAKRSKDRCKNTKRCWDQFFWDQKSCWIPGQPREQYPSS